MVTQKTLQLYFWFDSSSLLNHTNIIFLLYFIFTVFIKLWIMVNVDYLRSTSVFNFFTQSSNHLLVFKLQNSLIVPVWFPLPYLWTFCHQVSTQSITFRHFLKPKTSSLLTDTLICLLNSSQISVTAFFQLILCCDMAPSQPSLTGWGAQSQSALLDYPIKLDGTGQGCMLNNWQTNAFHMTSIIPC